MARQYVQVQVFPAFRRELSVPWLRRVAKQALLNGGRTPYGMSLAITDDETIRRLNREYRGLDETTDVLAFAFDHPGSFEGDGFPSDSADMGPFITPPEEAGFAGEVVVSYPTCQRQAAALGHAANDEMALLIIHGVLHLLGYDHATPEEEEVMKAREQEALAELPAQEAHS
ncbi:MAG: rRNA maturation RNase YbeY [Dehalococcoidia bacterium]